MFFQDLEVIYLHETCFLFLTMLFVVVFVFNLINDRSQCFSIDVYLNILK